MRAAVWIACLVLPSLGRAATDGWIEIRSPHFELLTNAAERDGRGLLLHLEELGGLQLPAPNSAFPLLPAFPERVVRIVAFRSAAEYSEYRLRDTASAYYAGGAHRDYIVMPLTGPEDYGTAAHEYGHAAAHGQKLREPPWLSEGMAEVFARVRFAAGQAMLAPAEAARLQLLREKPWIPLAELVSLTAVPANQGSRNLFYSESWALTDMLLFAPAYATHFSGLLAACAKGLPDAGIIEEVFKTPAESLERDLKAWLAARSKRPISLAAATAGEPTATPWPARLLPPSEIRLALAALLLDTGDVTRARAAYADLEKDFPRELPVQSAVQAGLTRIALAAGDLASARDRFRRSVESGNNDAGFYYEYATAGEDLGLETGERIAALERAVALNPAFDDARFSLGLAYMNAGRYGPAREQLRGIRDVQPKRAFGYYAALAHSQLQLGLDAEAAGSAAEAARHARTGEEAREAAQLAWMARSDIAVQLSGDGTAHLTRVARGEGGAPAAWNPFVEPGDRMERKEGLLQEVDCSPSGTRLVVSIEGTAWTLAMPDPKRVQVRGSGSDSAQLTCGKQEGVRVMVEYAAKTSAEPATDRPKLAGILRGIEFLP